MSKKKKLGYFTDFGIHPYHILKLACGDQKNNFHFVTIKFLLISLKGI
jgi:hypothetical protein